MNNIFSEVYAILCCISAKRLQNSETKRIYVSKWPNLALKNFKIKKKQSYSIVVTKVTIFKNEINLDFLNNCVYQIVMIFCN